MGADEIQSFDPATAALSSRRRMLKSTAVGFGHLALCGLLGQQSIAEDQASKVFIQSIIYLPMMMCILLMERLF